MSVRFYTGLVFGSRSDAGKISELLKKTSKCRRHSSTGMATHAHLEAWERGWESPDRLVNIEVGAVHCYAAVAATKAKLPPRLGHGFEDRTEAETAILVRSACDALLEGLVNCIDRLDEMCVFGIAC